MEFDLIPQIIIIISSGIIIVILCRNIPKAKNLNEKNLFFNEKKEEKKEKEKFFYLYNRIKKRISKEKYQEMINLMWVWFEKILRKIRISFLKIDNKIISLLNKLKERHKEIKIDKNKKIDNIGEYERDIKKEEVEKIEINEKEAGIVKNTNINELEEIINEDDQEKTINNISKKEDAKGKEKEYIEMILKNPIDIKTYWKLGIVYSRRRNYKDAISCFRQITKIDPTYTKAKKKISDLMNRMKEKKDNRK